MSHLTRHLRTTEFFMCGHQKETTEVIPIGSLGRAAPDIHEHLPRRYPCEKCMPLFAKELKLREIGVTDYSISNGSQWAAKLDEFDNDPLFSDGSLYFPATGKTVAPNLQHVEPAKAGTTPSRVLTEAKASTRSRVPSAGLQKATENLITNLQRAKPQRVQIQDHLNEMDVVLERHNQENEQAMDEYFKRIDKQNRNKKWKSIARRPKTFM